jgi:hypothetical protein
MAKSKSISEMTAIELLSHIIHSPEYLTDTYYIKERWEIEARYQQLRDEDLDDGK